MKQTIGPSLRDTRGTIRFAGQMLWRSRAGFIGVAMVVPILAAIVVGPFFYTTSPFMQDLARAFEDPSWSAPLGTDHLGRDVLARILEGGRTSSLIGVVSVGVGASAAALLGISAALIGGVYQVIVLRCIDALLAVPGIVQAVIWVAVIGRGLTPLIIALSIYSIPIFARVMFNATSQVITLDYYAAATVLGIPLHRRMFNYVLLNVAPPMLVLASLRIGANISTAATLSFFGLGVQPPDADWGLMIAAGAEFSFDRPLLIIFPGLALFALTLGSNLLGDGIRDWTDPKWRTSSN